MAGLKQLTLRENPGRFTSGTQREFLPKHSWVGIRELPNGAYGTRRHRPRLVAPCQREGPERIDTNPYAAYSRYNMSLAGSMAARRFVCASSFCWYWFTSGFSPAN